MTPELLARLQSARAASVPVALATQLPGGLQALLPEVGCSPALQDAAARVLASDRSATVTVDGASWFIQAYNPPPRLIIVGAVHIAQAMAPMAVQLGYGVTVIDPRGAFASAERFPGVALSTDWPDEALDTLAPDSRTAIVTLTHDPKLDDPALDRALRSQAFYVGSLGSRKTHAARLERLRALGHDDAALARIHGPVGLNLGAVTAAEIALSALAQIVAVRRQ